MVAFMALRRFQLQKKYMSWNIYSKMIIEMVYQNLSTFLKHCCHFDSILYLDLSMSALDRLDSWDADGWWQPPSWICGLDPAIRRFWGAESLGLFFSLVIGMLLSCSLSDFLSDLDRVGVSLRLPLLPWCATSRRAPWGYKTFDGRKPPRCWKTSVANPRCKRS